MFDTRFEINGKFAPELALDYIEVYVKDTNQGKIKINELLNNAFGNDKNNHGRLLHIEKNIKSLWNMTNKYIKGELSLKNLPPEISDCLIKLSKTIKQ